MHVQTHREEDDCESGLDSCVWDNSSFSPQRERANRNVQSSYPRRKKGTFAASSFVPSFVPSSRLRVRLHEFRNRFPMDDRAFDLLSNTAPEVQQATTEL